MRDRAPRQGRDGVLAHDHLGPPLSSKSERHDAACPAQAANADVRHVAGDPTARAGVRALAFIREFLSRCSPEADVLAFAGPRRYQPPVFAGQCPLAGWETVSKSAIDRAMTEDRGS
jgi:hypothetical protein